ncbi:Rieske (2Fe-2S) protein [Streptomyces sp. SudanB182_2057]|uniref:Rieske (2Fe-2S) protein n=1 Tax=Streptomyces sp. SudanB182_2057 TaxID=3035281 RepID=UPI003F54B841
MKRPPEVTIEQTGDNTLKITIGDKQYEIEAFCPHRRGHLAHGYVNTRALRITCPLHHSSYSLETGTLTAGPSGRTLCSRRIDQTAEQS